MNKKMLLIGVLVSTSFIMQAAHAEYCAPSAGAALANQYVKDVKNDMSNIDDLYDSHAAEINSVNDSFSCSEAWTTPGVSVSFQNVVDLLKKAGQQAISKACNAAKDKITEAANQASQKVSLNTSNIPGLDQLGMGNIASITSNTSSGGGVSVNGSNTTWNQIYNASK
ncbi:hypothetical protein E1N66_19385 [Pantoea allii]|nr:hypothetical protein [Pantoea allii]THB82735.1 hypothetical protein E1N66_19385 [Pantoea allii]